MSKCGMCEKELTPMTEEESKEAEAELHEQFGNYTPDECSIVCDDCYQKMFPDFPALIEMENRK